MILIVKLYNDLFRNNTALKATITVDKDIRNAAIAGWRKIPYAASAPAANGIATIL